MRRSLVLVPLVLLLLVVAPSAWGGGFATVGLSSTPTGVGAGEAWTVDVTVLAHGRTPVDGIAPVVRISSGTTERAFTAVPTERSGVYRADVVFPSAGRWRYEVSDGYMQEVHSFPPVEIGGTASAAGSRTGTGGVATGWLWGAAGALALALAVLAAGRLRRHGAPEPA